MAASGSGGEPGRPWTATSTWAPAGGAAVEDAVSFETTAVDAETSPSAVALARPPSDGGEDPTPCEVTFNFTGKYEIHRVYVRSTARIYEIYYSTDQKDTSKDYLCTVRCGIAAQEPLPCGQECMSQGSSNAATGEKHEQETKSLTSSSDEDSWVEVKIPESPLGNSTPESQERNVIGSCQKNTLVHYEATAEITDANPCVSLTVRLLSLQSKTSVHIDEIYIYADPVESSSDDSAADPGNIGGSSLLAMLVPGLMQISKSRDCKIDNKYFSDGLKERLPEGCTFKDSIPGGNIVQEAGLYGANDSNFGVAGLESRLPPAHSGTICDENGNQRESLLNGHKSPPLPIQTTETMPVTSAKDKTVSNTNQDDNPVMTENVTPHNRIERMLDTLLSKVDKVELYCSRFEDKVMRPLSSIEARLQRLEQQFDSFSVEIQSLRDSSARMSAPNVLSDTTNSQEKEHNDGSSETPASVTDMHPGLVIKAPEFPLKESCCSDVADDNTVNLCGPNVVPRLLVKAPDFIYEPGLTCEKLHDGPLPSEKERKTSPGLVISVPEFASDDEDNEVEEDKEAEAGDLDDALTNSYDTMSKSTDDGFRGKTPVSVDGALATALEAFLTSTKGTSLSKSDACTVSNLSDGNFADSSTSCFAHEHVNEIPTKDGSVGQFHRALVDADKIGAAISFQEVEVAPHISLSKANLVGNVEVNEQNIDLNPDKKAFASSEPLNVLSQSDTGSVDDCSQVNGQNNGPNSDTMPLVISTEPLDDPSQLPTHLGSVDERTQVKAKRPAIFESVDEIAQVNGRPSLPLAEFLVARSASSGTSEVCRGNDGTAIPSFQRKLAGANINLEGGDSKASQKNPTFQLSLLKKALEVDEGDSKFCEDISIETTFEPSSYAASNGHGTGTMDTLSDEDEGLENREDSISLSGGMNSLFFELPDWKEGWNANSNMFPDPNESFKKPNVEHSWSDSSNMELFGGLSSTKGNSSANAAAGNLLADLYVGDGASSNVTPIAGTQLQKVYDLLYECEHDILGMSFVGKRASASNPSLEVLLGESSDSEAPISDQEDVNSDAGFGSDHLFTTFSSSDDDAFDMDKPLVDVPVPSEANVSASNEPLVDLADLTNPSGTYTPSVNKPFADVADLAEPSDLYASAANEFLTSDLPKTSETFVGGSSGEHPDSLI
ncbi:uncharacterized protein LOC124672713 [Lolium rigidum]|uniref:uncharacterized protein LOC124672713 n=1 Tax=Lolium rigidum TaxID=89674 RepID=UPI001F5CB68B|nr:uncharacterized protein LOC124672713 [Lolium rigidum]